ncbi:hypothetical protein D3C78_1769590 [compost metagenome]
MTAYKPPPSRKTPRLLRTMAKALLTSLSIRTLTQNWATVLTRLIRLQILSILNWTQKPIR